MRNRYVLVGVLLLFVCVLSMASTETVSATPNSPGVIPSDVGKWDLYRRTCNDGALLAAALDLPDVNANCQVILNTLDGHFDDAYLHAEEEGASPGWPVNQIHFWNGNGILIQDFVSGHWGEGAIIRGWTESKHKPEYVGGGAWIAFKRAANNYGVFPGYPINREHNWNGVRIQDFRGGSWGDGAIIGGAHAELVAGNHWKAYMKADGSNRLGNPKTFVYQATHVEKTWWVQKFEGGEIWERSGQVGVHFSNGAPSYWFFVE